MSTAEKIIQYFTYAVIFLLILVGVLLLAGYFPVDPNLRLIFGFILIIYGVIRFLTVRWKYRKKDEIQDSKLEK